MQMLKLHFNVLLCTKYNTFKLMLKGPSRGGLEVEACADNSLHSALVGANPAWIWYIDRAEVETLCCNSNCKVLGAAMPLLYMPQGLVFLSKIMLEKVICILL